MATVSFLASRAIPAGGFLIALAGGVALARAGQQAGSRRGYGASIAAVLETTATMGPARFNVPVTQALTAPLLGRLEARGTRAPAQVAVCALIRLLHNAAVSAFFVVVIAGGVDDYAAAFRAFVGWIAPLPRDRASRWGRWASACSRGARSRASCRSRCTGADWRTGRPQATRRRLRPSRGNTTPRPPPRGASTHGR
ncbi:MAG: hypothetical protein WKF31_08700 [Thermoleophilaceae bacterium]